MTNGTQPAEIVRLQTLDGLRGIALVFMTTSHLNQQLTTVLGKAGFHAVGWVDSAHAFVFLSGLVVGLVYGGIMLRKGSPAMARSIAKRAGKVYFYQALLLVLGFLLVAWLGTAVGTAMLDPYQQAPAAYLIASLAMVSVPENMGILPMYLFFMALTPLALRAFAERRIGLAMAISLAGWVVVQFGLTTMAADGAERWIDTRTGLDLKLGLGFDLLAWQTIYFLGLLLGYLKAAKRLDLSFLATARGRALFVACVAMAIALGLWKRAVFGDWLPAGITAAALSAQSRTEFSPIYFLSFLVDLYALGWLLLAGPADRSRLVRGASGLASRALNAKPLVFLGQHSLQVFAFHIALLFMVAIALRDQSVGELRGTAILFLGVASLYIPAFLSARKKRRTTRAKALVIARA